MPISISINDPIHKIMSELVWYRFNILLFETWLSECDDPSLCQEMSDELENNRTLLVSKYDELSRLFTTSQGGNHRDINDLAGGYVHIWNRQRFSTDERKDFHMPVTKRHINDVVEQILLTVDTPLHYSEIFALGIKKGLFDLKDKTQPKNIYRQLSTEIKNNSESRFIRVGPGIFSLSPSRRVFTVPENCLSEYIYCVPASSYGKFEFGNKVIVPPLWEALFISFDKIVARFSTGIHTIGDDISCATNNGKLIVQLCFVNLGPWILKWGTPQPIQIMDSDIEVVEIQGFGSFVVKVEDSDKFVLGIARIGANDIEWLLRDFACDRFTIYLQSTYNGSRENIGAISQETGSMIGFLNFLLLPLGLQATHFIIDSIRFTNNTLERIRELPDSTRLLGVINNKLSAVLSSVEKTHAEVIKTREEVILELSKQGKEIQAAFAEILSLVRPQYARDCMEIYTYIDQEKINSSEAEFALNALRKSLLEVQERNLGIPSNVNLSPLAAILDVPQMDVAHKLKITLPLIPFFVEYEGELQLGSGMNLEAAWAWLKAKIKK